LPEFYLTVKGQTLNFRFLLKKNVSRKGAKARRKAEGFWEERGKGKTGSYVAVRF